MTFLDFQLFGGCEISFASGIQPPLRAKKAKALLAYLAMHNGVPVTRATLAFLLWSDRSEPQARRSLRQTLSVLRKYFADVQPSPLVIERNTIMLKTSEVDVNRFAQFAQSNDPQYLMAAKELYKGDLFAGFVTGSPDFDEWIEQRRSEYQDMANNVLIKLLEHNLAAGQHKFAIDNLTDLLQFDPFCEEHHRTLMKIYAARNEKNKALLQFNLCRNILEQNLQIEPEPATQELMANIRNLAPVPTPMAIDKVALPLGPAAGRDVVGENTAVLTVANWADRSRFKLIQSLSSTVLVACSALVLGYLSNSVFLESGNNKPVSVADQTGSASYNAYVIGKFLTTKQTPAGHSNAINYFKQSLKLDPEQAQARAALASAYIDVYIKDWRYKENKESLPEPGEAYKLALLHAEIATKSSNPPALAQIVLAKAIYFGAKGSEAYDDAIINARLAADIEPDSAEAYYGLGQILVLGSDAEQAVPYLQRAQLMDPTIAKMAEYDLALAYFQMEQFNKAAVHIERALETSPEAYSIWTLAAATYAHLKEDKRAINAVTRAGNLSKQRGNGQISASRFSGQGIYIRAIDEHRMTLGIKRACELLRTKA